jgi:polyisoprenoid-binding protein YceI
MKKIFAFALLVAALSNTTSAQKYFTKTGYLGMFSKTKQEDIKADNSKVTYVFDAATGQLEISGLMTAFEFPKALMQEHFNENYVESEKFPKTTFKGKVDNMSSVNLTKDGTYKVKISGDLTLHGVTNKTTVDATFKVVGGKVSAEAVFPVSCKAYNVVIPDIVKDVISDAIQITAKANLEPLKR